jgi:DNA polymerase III sliding clamp (beta) subunit (PCNA family)
MLDGISSVGSSSTTNPYDDEQTCAMALADFDALGLDTTPVAMPGAFLLNVDVATIKALLPFACEDSTRYNLCGILVEVDAGARKLRLVATDGHALAVVERDILDVAGLPEACDAMGARERTAFILGRDALERAVKCAPRVTKTYKPAVQIEIAIDVEGNAACLAMLSGQARITDVVVDGVFPDWRQVVPARADKTSTDPIALNVLLLARCAPLADLIVKGSGVRVQTTGPLSPIRFDCGTSVYGAVMPMRL